MNLKFQLANIVLIISLKIAEQYQQEKFKIIFFVQNF